MIDDFLGENHPQSNSPEEDQESMVDSVCSQFATKLNKNPLSLKDTISAIWKVKTDDTNERT